MHLSSSEIKKLLKGWHFYKASILIAQDGGELERKLNAIEKNVGNLNDVDRTIFRMRFFERAEVEVVVAQVYLSRRAVYKRIDKAVEKMVYCIANTG